MTWMNIKALKTMCAKFTPFWAYKLNTSVAYF